MMSAPQYFNAETLVIDSEPYLRRSIQQYLRQAGIRKIGEAEDAESALGQIRKTRIELLIVDWNVLVRNDEFLLQNIKNWANVRGRFAFLIMMAEARESHVLYAINNGADSVLLKPFSASRFWIAVGNALQAREQREARAKLAS